MDIQFFKKLSFPKKFRFWSTPIQSIVGIDIGTSSIKIVQLKKEKERAILETYGALATGPYAGLKVGQAARVTEEKTVEMICDLFKESGAKAKDAAVSVSLRNTFVTTIELPGSSKDNLSDIVSLEARRYIPLPISEVILDWWVIPRALESIEEGEDGQPPEKRDVTEILLVAIYKEAIENYKNVIAKAGLNIQLFEIEIFSAIRSCIGREISPVLLIDLGASAAKMAIVDYGVVRSVHTFDRASQDLTLALSNSLGVDFSRAEEMKQEIGFSSRPENKEIVSIMEPIVQYTFAEASRFIADYRRKHNRSVGRVILTGGGSLIKGLIDIAVKSFGVEVAIGNSFSKVEYPSFLETALKQAGPTFSTALGVAIRGLQSS
ncbi:MAG: type IV pilus assembly protein PilM [Candidatus Tagabacteria bacterium]